MATGVRPEKDTLQNLPAEICRKWYQNFQVNNNIIINDLEEIRESDPLQYENLKRQDSEKLMYEDKAAYYREKGIDRRR